MNFRKLVLKKAWKLKRLGRKNPLKKAWEWYYNKLASKINVSFETKGDTQYITLSIHNKIIDLELIINKTKSKKEYYIYAYAIDQNISFECVVYNRKDIKTVLVKFVLSL
jgi:hypothetical protein